LNNRKQILVTGGTGFLGSHLCERPLADGHDVLCVDNFFTGTRDSQTRAFRYVDDLIEGFIRPMQTSDDVTGPVNLGNPVEISILSLATKIIELTGSRSTLLTEPLPEDDPLQRCPDISLAKRLLDWEPKVALEQGLGKCITYFDSVLRATA
jgi:UDP-glucuronate decarboxylase